MDLYLQTEFDQFTVEQGLFCLKKGEKAHTFHPQRISRIWLNAKTMVEGEVIQFALKNHIDIVFLTKEGFPIGNITPYNRTKGITLQEKQWQLTVQPDGATYVSLSLIQI